MLGPLKNNPVESSTITIIIVHALIIIIYAYKGNIDPN